MTSKSGNESVSLTGPVVSQAGTAGHLPAGYALREFQVERVLGEGGFSVVYVATDTRLERQVAIKEYMPTALATRNPDLSINVRSSAQHREAFDAGLRSFINEAKLLARFEHRALVKVHQFWQEKGTAYMVMPFYSGPTLKVWVKQRSDPVDPAWLEQFLRLVMDALETLHKENCLHRDVAPDNILVLNERVPLLLDFGAARRVIGDLTQALTVILKPGFAPIEQYAESQSMRQGPWTDVYALCAVAHFMITGRAPTPSVTRVLADDLVPLRAAAEGRFPAAFLAALDAGLTVRPQQRPQSIGALRDLMNGAAVPDETLTAPPGAQIAAAPARPVPVTRQPLPRMAEPEAGDDDKTRIVTARDLPLRTGSDTISSPTKPAMAPIDAATTPEFTEDPTFESRFPSRSMREHDAAISQLRAGAEADRESRLPLILGVLAIAAVIAGAWVLISRLNDDIAQSRRIEPAYTPAPAPAPAPQPSSPSSQIAAPATVAATIPPPPEPTPTPAPVATAPEPKDMPAPAEPSSAASAESPSLKKTMAPTTLQPEAEPAPAPATKPTTPTPVATKPAARTQSAAASPSFATKKSSPVAASEVRHMNDLLADASKSGAPVPTETPRIRSPSIQPSSAPPAEETQVAASVSVPSVATVQAQAPTQIAAAEPSRVAVPPSPPPTTAPLRALSRPEPMFPREAARESVDKGTVTARLFIAPDGSVNKVDILSAHPPRVFDREVRDTVLRWRYEPPGQARQADVEFVFDRFKER